MIFGTTTTRFCTAGIIVLFALFVSACGRKDSPVSPVSPVSPMSPGSIHFAYSSIQLQVSAVQMKGLYYHTSTLYQETRKDTHSVYSQMNTSLPIVGCGNSSTRSLNGVDSILIFCASTPGSLDPEKYSSTIVVDVQRSIILSVKFSSRRETNNYHSDGLVETHVLTYTFAAHGLPCSIAADGVITAELRGAQIDSTIQLSQDDATDQEYQFVTNQHYTDNKAQLLNMVLPSPAESSIRLVITP